MSIRLLLADDQAVFRRGFRALAEDEADIEVVGEAGLRGAAGPHGRPSARPLIL